MKLRSVEKVAGWEYLTRYDVKYETPSGGEKVYEMFSRDPGIDSTDKLLHPRTDAVMIIMTDRSGEKLLLIHEFRLELGREIYGLPAGLIDPGETPEQTARRELKEETGLDLVEIHDVLRPAYSAVGLSNEQCICIFGVAEGEIAPSKETGEEITARWYSKDELRHMLAHETFGSWAQAYSYAFTRTCADGRPNMFA